MKRAERKIRLTGRLVFAAYLMMLVYFLFFAEWYQHGPGIREVYRYNFRPFEEIRRFIEHRESLGLTAVITNLAGNVIGFIPYGFITPVMDRKLSRFRSTLLAGAGLSIFVEGLQLITKLGICDIDDVILNVTGIVIGYGLFLKGRKVRRQRIHAKGS